MQVSRPQAAAPVLQIPTDQSRWQMMQKGLIAGGVYHVMMPDGGRQYCLWNGKQLVPCKLAQVNSVLLQILTVKYLKTLDVYTPLYLFFFQVK